MIKEPSQGGYPVPSPEIFSSVEVFTEGKNPPRNEDLTGQNETTLVLSDGATDKTGQSFEGQTGGELASRVVVETCLASDAYGEALVSQVTSNLQQLYADINPNALTDSQYRFAATMVAVKAVGDQLIVTQVGDTSFRINGRDIYTNDKQVDALTADARRSYIEVTGDVDGGREFIMPLLKEQHKYQNNPVSPLGYGVIDGTPVPAKFIKTFSFPKDSIHTVELVSDGYYGLFPESPTIAGYEAGHEYIEASDPNKCGRFASTKLHDDRTVLIAHLNS